MSARQTKKGTSAPSNVVPFPRAHLGPGEWSDAMDAQQSAIAAARRILAAKASADNWMGVMLLGLLASMDKPALLRLELAIGTHAECNEQAAQALALVRLNGSDKADKEHRARVRAVIDALQRWEG